MATKLTKKSTKPVKPIKTTSSRQVKNFTRGLGRRKSSVARVRIFTGKQEITINNQPVSEYWPQSRLSTLYLEPFQITNTLDKYTASVKITGGGTKGQIGAFVHGVSKALAAIDLEKFRPILKEKGFLTRDPRMKETRKVGRAGKARFKKQSPKR